MSDSKTKLKARIKEFVFNNSFLRGSLSNIYTLGGKRPWSLGYTFYKFSFIKDTILNHLNEFNQNFLPSGFGVGMDERVVEYPWAVSRIENKDKVILDAGSSLNQPDILKLPVWEGKDLSILTLDFEGCYHGSLKPRYFYEDLRRTTFPDNHFDLIISISTIEHVGMDNTFLYTKDQQKNENRADDYLVAIDEMKRVLKPGGKFLVTVPFGKHKNHGWFQIFDQNMINKLIECFNPSEKKETYFKYEKQGWNFSSADECRDGYFFDIHQSKITENDPAASLCVACLELVK